ncbi:hypothetical protein [Psychromonas arctica]|uniref:hypothetical protein n=1 Tax=Psychromonas arctica TaxID=168275 RepID=UPI002FD5EEE0
MMKVGDVKTIFELMKEASHVQMIYIGLAVAPFVIGAWFDVIERIPSLAEHKLISLLIVLVFVFLMLVVAVVFDHKDKKRKLLLSKVSSYMVANKFNSVRFSAIRNKFNISDSDAYLTSVINTFPDRLRLVSFSVEGSDVDKEPGFGIVTQQVA